MIMLHGGAISNVLLQELFIHLLHVEYSRTFVIRKAIIAFRYLTSNFYFLVTISCMISCVWIFVPIF